MRPHKNVYIKRAQLDQEIAAIEICSDSLRSLGIHEGDCIVWQADAQLRPEEGDFIVAQAVTGMVVGFYQPPTPISPARIKQDERAIDILRIEGFVIGLHRDIQWKAATE